MQTLKRAKDLFRACNMCSKKFTKPKVLNCLHTFCAACLQSSIAPGNSVITCQTCRQETPVPRAGVSALKANNLVNAVQEKLDFQQQISGEGGRKAICNSCKDNKEASARCVECARFFCVTCKAAHQRMDFLAGHQMISIDDLKLGRVKEGKQQATECAKHDDEKAKFYCLTCEELICHICIVLEHRDTNEHDLVDVGEACKQRKDAVRNFLPTVAEVRNKFNRSERQAEKTNENMEANIDLVKEQIEKESAAIVNMVEEERKKLTSQLDIIKHNRRQAIADMKVLAANVGKQTQHAYDLAKTAIDEATEGDFLSLYPILIGKLQQLCHETPGDIDSKLEYVDFTGPASKHNIDLGTVVEKLGWQMSGEFGREGVADGEFKLAQGIIACPNGDLAVTDSGNARVTIFNSRGEFKTTLKPSEGKPESNFRRPADIARNSHDQFVVVDQSRYVKIFDGEGHFVRGFATIQAGEDPNTKVCPVSVAVDPQDRIFVADYIRRVLTIHQHDGNLIKKVPLEVKPWILTINSKQQILVSDYAAGKVECIDLNGRSIFTIDTLIDGIQGKAAGVCCDANDDIYVAIHPGTYGSSPVHQYSSTGQFVNVIAKGLYNPQCMSFTVDGRLAVADTISVKMFKLKSI